MTEIRASLDHCIKCTICETYCPVSNVTPLFTGPKFVGPQAERFRDHDVSPDDSLDYCSGCGICTHVCPQGVKIAEINSQARAELKADRGVPLRDKLIARPSVFGRLATPVAPAANWALRNRPLRAVAEKTIGIHRSAPMPRFAGRRFSRWAKRHRSPASHKRIVYFHGCSVDYFEPKLGEMAIAVLEHNGFEVLVPPKQGCCGLPLQSNGLFDDARDYVKKLTATLSPYARAGYDIVSTSTSCGLMLKREAREILGVEHDNLRVVSAQMYDICEYLVGLHDRGELEMDLSALAMRVPYHAPCQQKGHGMGSPALDLFALIPGLEVYEQEADCCGVAGTYGLKKEKYEIAMDVGARLFEDIKATHPDAAACDSETCRWQITQATDVASVHPVELLYRSYRLGDGARP
jgi:glycerol-3-phosphate dehydrogenase subunit C